MTTHARGRLRRLETAPSAAARIAGHPGAVLRIAVAINPRAAFGRSRHVGDEVVARLRAAGHTAVVLRKGNYAQLADAVAAELAAGTQALMVVGGDGMVHLGVNALAGTDVRLGIVPAGTGNDTARGLGIARGDIDAAVDQFLAAVRRPPRSIDLGRVRTGERQQWFAGALSAGFDAVVNERANRWRWPRGQGRYNLAMLCELVAFRPPEYALVVDGVPERRRAMLISVANGRSIGGGMKITPDARLDDGLLDLLIVQPLSRTRLLAIFPKVFSGRHVGHPAVSIRRVRSVSIALAGQPAALVAYADGERIGPLPLTVEVVPGALKVWA